MQSNLTAVSAWRLFAYGRFIGSVECTFAELLAGMPASATVRAGGGVELWRRPQPVKPEFCMSESTHFDPQALRARVCRDRFGFVNEQEVALLAGHKDSRLWQLLVRCGACRFIVAAQDAQHVMAAIVAHGDYVRDVSFPAESAR